MNRLTRRSFIMGISALGAGISLLQNSIAVPEAWGSSSLQVAYNATRIATGDTLIPEGPGNFAGLAGAFDSGPSVSGGNVAFSGLGEGDHRGVFAYIDGALHRIADVNTQVPGKDQFFSADFGHASISGSQLAFTAGFGSDAPSPFPVNNIGVYRHNDGVLQVVADDSTEVPGRGGQFQSYFGASQDANNTVFLGFESDGQTGVYVSNGNDITELAGPDTLLLGAGSALSTASTPAVFANTTAFCAFSADRTAGGVYRARLDAPGVVEMIADLNTAIPGGEGVFTDFGVRMGLADDVIGFVGFGSGGQAGVYAWVSGELVLIADTSTAIPNGVGTFLGFSKFNDVSASGNKIVFSGAGTDEQGGIYLYDLDDGTISSVVQHGELLDGSMIQVNVRVPDQNWWEATPPYSLNYEAIEGNHLAALVELPDLSSGIYLFELNED